MNLLNSFRSEILKTRRSASLYFTIIAAAIVPLIFLLDVTFDGVSAPNRIDPLNAFFREGFGVMGLVIFPMFVILICTLLPQIEYRNNTWKQVFASPQGLAHLFMAKFLNVQLLILIFLVSFNVFMALSAVAAHFIDPSLNLLNQRLDKYELLTKNLNFYIAILAVSAIQFCIGLRLKNFIIPVAIGIAMWFAALLMLLEFEAGYASFFPYAYLAFSSFPKYASQLGDIQVRSVGYAALFLIIGFIDFTRRRIRA
jgi:hypothetical protein